MRRLTGLFLLTTAAALAFPNPDSGCSITTGAVLPQAVRGVAISYSLATNGCGTLRTAFAVTGSLPEGLKVTVSGTAITISGTPLAEGVSAFGLRTIDQNYLIPSKSFVIKVNAPVRVDTPALASGLTGAAYSDTVRARGGVAPYTFSIVEGALPSGLTLGASTGTVSGTMPAAGSRFRVRVSDSSTPPNVAEHSYTIAPGGQITTLAAAPAGSVGTAYSFDVDGSLGQTGFVLALGTLPPGLTMSTSGLISGTPTTAGEYHVTARQTAGTASAWRSYRILINSAGSVTGSPRDAEEAFAYNHVFAATGGVEPCTFSVSAGALPTGITLDSGTGALLGELPVGGTGTSFTIQALDATGRSYSQAFSINRILRLITGGPSQTPPEVVLYAASSATPFSLAQGGPGKKFTQIGGSGRDAIYFDPTTGEAQYTFYGAGDATPVVVGEDSLGGGVVFTPVVFRAARELRINDTIELPNGQVSVAYNASISVINADFTPLTFTVSAGALPTGLTLNAATGAITGTPASGQAGQTFAFTILVTDPKQRTASRNFEIGIGGAISITTNSVPTAVIGVPYTATIAQTGGTLVSWAEVSENLPPGLTVNSSTGVISGTPTQAGSYTVRIMASQAAASAIIDYKVFTILVTTALNASAYPDSPMEATEGSNVFSYIYAGGGRAPYTLSITGGTLPEGLRPSQTAQSLGLAGTPEIAGTSNFNMVITDADGNTITIPYTVNVRKDVLITTEKLAPATRTVAYNQTLTATGGRAPYSWSVIFNSTLPPGLTLSTDGVLSGTPTTNGSFSPEIQVVDADGRGNSYVGDFSSAEKPANLPVRAAKTAPRAARGQTLAQKADSVIYSMQVTDPLVITNTVPLLPGVLLNPYTAQITTTGGNGSNTFSISAGDLPPLFPLNPLTGLIQSSPLLTGTFTFTVRAEDSAGRVGTLAEQITVGDGIVLSPSALPDSIVGTAYAQTLTALNAAGAVSWSVVGGALPGGLFLGAANGQITGTPTTPGTFPFIVGVVDSQGQSRQGLYSIVIDPLLTMITTALGEAVQGRAYASTLVASGGRAPYTWSIAGATLPAGLVLNPGTGQVTGLTNAPEAFYPQVVTVTDSLGRFVTRTISLHVVQPPAPPLVISPDTLPAGRVGQPYGAQISGSGGRPGHTISLVGGNLPPGLTFSGGSVSGTPVQAGTFRFTVNLTDSAGAVLGNLYTVVIEPALEPLVVTPASIAPTTQLGQVFSVLFGATGGKAPYTFASSGNLPPGTVFTSDGLLNGTPTQGGSFSFSVEVTDSFKAKASRPYTINVTGTLTITTEPPLAEGAVGTPYSVGFGATGGRPPYTWSATGSTPPGLTLDTDTGTLSGTPSAAGSFGFSVTVRDAQRQTATASFSITIFDKLEITNAPSDAAVVVGQPFTFGFVTKGGKQPVTFSTTGGALPPGLSMSGTGEISGTPTAAGSFNFTAQAVDALKGVATRAAALRVVAALTVTTKSLPSGTVGVDYSAGLSASGGTPPIGSWSISQGSLPAGLSLSGDGAISGKPTTPGTASFTVRIADSAGTVATQGLSITIGLPSVPPLNITGLPQALAPGTQTNITIQLAAPFPVPVAGTLTLIFEPNAVNNADDPSVQFSSGGRTVTFVIPAGQTSGTFPVDPLRLITGTVAGNIRLRTATSPESATPVPDSVVPITRTAPVITAGTAQLGTGVFTLLIDGFSNTREISSATFRMTPVAGAPLQTSDVSVSVASAYTTWYQSAASAPFGGQFRLTMPFNVSGSLADIDSVVVTVTNTVGTSQPFTVRLR